jgi:hypothetical protein
VPVAEGLIDMGPSQDYDGFIWWIKLPLFLSRHYLDMDKLQNQNLRKEAIEVVGTG